MASIVSTIFSGGIEGAGKGIASVISAIKGKNPEDAAKLAQMQVDLQELQAKYASDFALAKIEENVKLNDIAGQNVRADAQSGDKFTSRARPGIIWVGLFIMSWSYVVIPILAIHWQFLKPVDFPSMFWEAWGIVATGVVMTRSADKIFGGAGGSAQLPFGIKVDSKGD